MWSFFGTHNFNSANVLTVSHSIQPSSIKRPHSNRHHHHHRHQHHDTSIDVHVLNQSMQSSNQYQYQFNRPEQLPRSVWTPIESSKNINYFSSAKWINISWIKMKNLSLSRTNVEPSNGSMRCNRLAFLERTSLNQRSSTNTQTQEVGRNFHVFLCIPMYTVCRYRNTYGKRNLSQTT